jgi:hypothetical protein
MDKRHKICSRSSANHEGCLRLHWGLHKGLGLSQPHTSPNDHQDLVQFCTIKSPRRRGQYKFSEAHHNLGGSWRTPNPSRGQVPKSKEKTEIVGDVPCLKIERVTQKMTQISLKKLRCEWSLKETELELKKCWFKEFSSQWSGQLSKGGCGPLFIAPKRNLPVRVSEIRTCPTKRPDMFEKDYWNPILATDMFDTRT